MAETGVEGIGELRAMRKAMTRRLPRYVFHALAKGLYDEGRAWLNEYRRGLDSKFQARGAGKRIGRSFKVYTSGQKLSELELGLFTRWAPAEIYEKGGTIRAQRGYLVVPVTRRAYTAAGRVKRAWRDPQNPGKFDPSKFRGLRPIKVRAGILLVRDVRASAGGGGRVSIRKPGKRSGSNAIEPVFLLIKRTKRKAVLGFFDAMERNLGDSRALQAQLHDALQALGRDVGQQ